MQEDPLDILMNLITQEMTDSESFLITSPFCSICEEYNNICSYLFLDKDLTYQDLYRKSMIFLMCEECFSESYSDPDGIIPKYKANILDKLDRYIQSGTFKINYLQDDHSP